MCVSDGFSLKRVFVILVGRDSNLVHKTSSLSFVLVFENQISTLAVLRRPSYPTTRSTILEAHVPTLHCAASK